MQDSHHQKGSGACSRRLVCDCLQISEAELVEAMNGREIKPVKDVRRLTASRRWVLGYLRVIKSYIEGFVVAPT